MEEIISRKFQALKSEWSERQRRLWAASEATVASVPLRVRQAFPDQPSAKESRN
jgi:hypothetical protein